MKQKLLSTMMLVFSSALLTQASPNTSIGNPERENDTKSGYAGSFEAEGKKIDVKFVRVLFAAEGSENEGESNDTQQLVFDSTDPNGNAVKVYRYQITAKNTGYDELQSDKEADYKLKSVENGIKLHIEVPLKDGAPQFEKAYVGNLAYNFGTRETRHILTADAVSDVKLQLSKLELPTFGADSKPGDKGIVYNQGYIKLKLSSSAKHIGSDDVSPFNITIDSPISVTHIRGKERADRAVSIEPSIVQKNVK